MRLKNKEAEAIKTVIKNMDADAKIYLFGSRADDSKKGGDIDLLIISKIINNDNIGTIKLNLFKKLGEQKIDIVIAENNKKPFVRIALDQGVLL